MAIPLQPHEEADDTTIQPNPRPRAGLTQRAFKFALRFPTLLGFGVLIAVTLGMHLVWGWRENAEFIRYTESIRQAGEPLSMADVPVLPVPAEEDAWPLLLAAIAADTGVSPSNTNFTFPDYPPYGSGWSQAAEASEQAHVQLFQLARKARDYPRAQFRKSWSGPIQNVLMAPNFSGLRRITTTLGDGAAFQSLQGNEAEALERILDQLHIARLTESEETIIGQLVTQGLYAVTTNRAHVIGPRLELKEANARELTEKLIVELLHEERSANRFADAFVFERVFALEVTSQDVFALQPLLIRHRNRLLGGLQTAIAASRESNLVAAKRILGDITPDPSASEGFDPLFGPGPGPARIPRYSRWFSEGDISDWIGRYFVQRFRSMGERRTTATMLAAQLYRVDHQGRWPDRLEALVPRYLPALPADPFHEDGRPLGYVVKKRALPDGRDRPLVYYDAGEDFEGSIDSEPMTGWNPGTKDRTPRQYRDVAAWTPSVRRIDIQMKEEQEAAEAAQKEQMEEEERILKELEELGVGPPQPNAPPE